MCGNVLMRHGESTRKLESRFGGRIGADLKLIKRCCLTDPQTIAVAMNAVANQGTA